MEEKITFQTVAGDTVSLPAKDFLYTKKGGDNPAVRVLVFYTGNAPDGGFLNTPYTVKAEDADRILNNIRKIIFNQ